MVRTPISSALLVTLTLAFGACAKNQPADTTTASAPSQSTAAQPQGQGMMAGQGMMGGGQGVMGPGMMDGGAGMMGPGMMDAGPGMMGGSGMMGNGQGMMSMMMVMMGMGDHCPMLVPGATVQAKDTTNGMAMTFATTGDVAELRRRVRVMAEHMNAAPGSSGGMGMHGTMMGADAGMGMMGGGTMGAMMPAVRAEVEDVDKGARLKMTPVDASKLGEMREHMKQHVQMMNQSHGCPMAADAGK